MESDQIFEFICLDDPKRFSFNIKLSPADIEILSLQELKIIANEKANKLGTGIGMLYDFYKNVFEDNSEKLKKKVAYYKELFPFKFDQMKKIKVKVIFKNELQNTEEVKEIEIFPFNTVEVLKQAIFDNFKCPTQEQGLLFDKVSLDDDTKMLSEYVIKSGSTINLIVVETKECSTKSFVDVSKNMFEDRYPSKDAPKYRYYCKGINIEGLCKNSKCEAYKKQVICPIKNTGVFDVIRDTVKIVCPLCKKNIDALTCGLSSCSYSFTGIKHENGMKVEVQSQVLTKVGYVYRQFDPIKSGKVDWESLKIIVKFDVPDLDDTDAQSVFCALCNKTDSLNGKSIKKIVECDKYFHDECYEKIKSFSSLCYHR